eukprot:m.35880 g.35880  ORF g.35880 m.35880 type:complete len:317 (+) comp11347_c0_seq1:245-1195(+)
MTLDRPNPPVVGKVTDRTIELYWEAALGGEPTYCVQEADAQGDWGTVYTGAAREMTASNLQPSSAYRYRLRVQYGEKSSPWSTSVSVSTTRPSVNGSDLHNAVAQWDAAAVREILQTGIVDVDVPDKFGSSPLMSASQKGFVSVVEELLRRGANINFTNGSGKTSLMMASFNGHLGVVEVLLHEKAKLQLKDNNGADALHLAADGGQAEVINVLVNSGCNVHARDTHSQWTPLHHCGAVSGSAAAARVLLQRGAKVDEKDVNGKTALMLAVLNNHTELVKVLLEFKADKSLQTSHGKTAKDFAQTFADAEIRQLLL